MRFQIALLTLVVLATGCKKPATVSVQPVTGKIMLRGKPLEGATVLFTNNNPDAPSASGTTDKQGEFKLSTLVPPKEYHTGAVSGEYTVIITKAPPAGDIQSGMADMEHATQEERNKRMEDQMKAFAEAKKGPQPKSEVPEKYSKKDSSPLKVTVPVGGEKFDWTLEE